MIRALIYMAIVFVLALGGAWIADRPGVVTLDWEGFRIQASLLTTLVALAAGIVALFIVWGIIRLIWRSPALASRFMRRRRQDRGFEALSKGLLALGAGQTSTARKFGSEADKLLKGNEPAVKLLLAQVSQISGNQEESRNRFEAMLDDPRTKSVGLHGLFLEAERANAGEAARHYAEEALTDNTGLTWAGKAVLGYQAVAGDWEQALKTLEKNYAAKLIDKATMRRHRAVILTARALELESQEPDRARTLAVEAHGLATSLIAASLVAARLLTRHGNIRKASKTLETTWKINPHPDLAEAYAHVRMGDSVSDRMARIKHLASLRPHSNEGALAIASAALDAQQFKEAREQLKKVLRSEPTQRAFLMMADLDELESGDQGRVREWLARAVRAPQDKVWIADGVVSANWGPVSPKTGRLDAYEWGYPEQAQNEQPQIEHIDDSLLEAPQLIQSGTHASTPQDTNGIKSATPEKVIEPEDNTGKVDTASTIEVETDTTAVPAGAQGLSSKQQQAPQTEEKPPVDEIVSPNIDHAADKSADETQRADLHTVSHDNEPILDQTSHPKQPLAKGEGLLAEAKKLEVEKRAKVPFKSTLNIAAKTTTGSDSPRAENLVEFPLGHMPDDPGTEEEEKKTPNEGNYKFFK
ncbi:heme biosynthesis protein HemY [Polycladidibacter stylochi]|uniref:heme biosynthesis protein HemY n=1 Tax=Polycladidibacter stylochi TaxID=1807766 RepID=UPI00082BEDF2|nr:heme biosynthesis HemY N-terminal domain-containing protein [Pseudovibrio stylochi]